ncbi:MAG: FecR domain-containing protein [Acidobacteria bacterium]|nr:FecR domain-containing protein [Acidobacteriota bacterium]
MTSVMLMLMLQFVVSTKAGLVNYVQGSANVRATQIVPTGVPIRTGPEGFAEILLNPGSFLRLGQNSEVVLEGVELVNVSIRIVSGSAVIEASGFTKELPLKVTSGNLRMRIIKDGIYVVEQGQVKIAEGRLQVDGKQNVYKKGWVVSETGALKFSKVNLLDVELWSRNRSNLIAVANANIANSIRRSPSLASSFYNVWLWDPSFGGFTYMPGYRYRSPYGYSYRSVQETYYGGGGGSTANSFEGGRSGSVGGSASSGGSSTGSGGGGFNATPAAPAVMPSSPNVSEGARPAQGKQQ